MKKILAFSLLTLAACSTISDGFEKSVAAYRSEAYALAAEPCRGSNECSLKSDAARARLALLDKLDLDACRTHGGLIEGVGIFGEPACVKHFTDAGKTCLDSADCQGDCMIYDEFETGAATHGQCAAQSPESGGCFARVSSGKVQPGLCI